MNERELLEMAAKAACIEHDGVVDSGAVILNQSREFERYWNPLADDGDCARLEAAAGINVQWFSDRVRSGKGLYIVAGACEFFADHNGGKNKARRYASTKCAAKIGRNI